MSTTTAVITTDAAIKAEAIRRMKAAEAERLAAASLAAEEARKKREAIERSVLEEQVRVRAQEEQIRVMAQRAAAEAEAKRLAKEREDAIAALISKGTLPPQIDYISSEKRAEWAKAEKFIENDPEALERVAEAINEYYESGVAEMDSQF